MDLVRRADSNWVAWRLLPRSTDIGNQDLSRRWARATEGDEGYDGSDGPFVVVQYRIHPCSFFLILSPRFPSVQIVHHPPTKSSRSFLARMICTLSFLLLAAFYLDSFLAPTFSATACHIHNTNMLTRLPTVLLVSPPIVAIRLSPFCRISDLSFLQKLPRFCDQ